MTTVINGSSPSITFSDTTTQTTAFTTTPVINTINSQASTALTLGINGTEAMRIDTSGNLLVGCTSIPSNVPNKSGIGFTSNGYATFRVATTGTYAAEFFNASGTGVGFIQVNTSSTTYSTSSDYRLKENIAPMQNALATVAALKPVTYKWKVDGSNGQGFIAHELQAVVPDCVTGKKDAVETVDDVDAEGKVIGTKEVPRYQGIDTSFLVATLTAAIQELNAKIEALTPATPTEAQVSAKQSAMAKLAKLGLTEDEVKALYA